MQMHGQMHVHAGWCRGYSFDDRFTEVLDCLTAWPHLSFPGGCGEVGGFGGGPVEAEHPLGGGAGGTAGAVPKKRELRGRAPGRPFDRPTRIRKTAAACEDGEK
ncbi:hypothetical protein C9J60_38465 [Streptomyces sp. A244]|nr:hypothetical protein C9J60_38465 [Streptomyces sp. A244]